MIPQRASKLHCPVQFPAAAGTHAHNGIIFNKSFCARRHAHGGLKGEIRLSSDKLSSSVIYIVIINVWKIDMGTDRRRRRRRRVIERRQWRSTTITIYARPNTRSLSHKITASHRIHLCARPNRYGWMAIINGAINWIEMERLNRQIQRLAKCENSLTFASRPCISANDDDDYEQYNELQAAVIWAYPLTDCTRKILTAGSRQAGGGEGVILRTK